MLEDKAGPYCNSIKGYIQQSALILHASEELDAATVCWSLHPKREKRTVFASASAISRCVPLFEGLGIRNSCMVVGTGTSDGGEFLFHCFQVSVVNRYHESDRECVITGGLYV